MTSLVACLSSGKGTWAHVAKLMRAEEWDNIYLITNSFGKENFNVNDKTYLVMINSMDPEQKIVDTIVGELKDKINDMDVALNFSSGTGKEHMCLLTAILKLGLGIRLVVHDADEMKVLL